MSGAPPGSAVQLVLPLALPRRRALGRGDFHVSPANAGALAMIEGWRGWPGGRLALTGPAGAGKSHLVQVWRGLASAAEVAAGDLDPERAAALAGAGAVAVEDGDRIPPARRAAAEAGLFHLHNLLAASGGALLVTGRSAPARWEVRLPDLASRLAAMPVAELDAPDDALLSSVLDKLLADRHIRAGAGLVPYLVRRIERSFAAAEAVVATLDARSLEAGARVTRDLARRVLDEAGAAPPPGCRAGDEDR